jgi:hypothetical protein
VKKIDLTDAMLFLGAICITAGIAQIYIPAAWIAFGVFLIAFAFLIAKEKVDNASHSESAENQ